MTAAETHQLKELQARLRLILANRVTYPRTLIDTARERLLSEEEAQKARALYPELVKKALSLGGTFSAEHGVGKLKRRYLTEFYGPQAVEEMKVVKRIFDPNFVLGRGNLFEL